MYILVPKGQNDPYYIAGQKWARLMKECLLSDRCADLEILMTGGLKPEYYIHKRIFWFLPSSKWLKKTYSVHWFLPIYYVYFSYYHKICICSGGGFCSPTVSCYHMYILIYHYVCVLCYCFYIYTKDICRKQCTPYGSFFSHVELGQKSKKLKILLQI